ncbi:MAG TPA: sulfur carrier protein ThiS [Crocinitomix sp.]|nr:sulfur carrier protein ThiS [Crocinitomix sp.]
MEITLNNQIINVPEHECLETVLKLNKLLNKKGIAVAINNTVIPKSNWRNTGLKDKDKILIITATAGG